MLLTYDARIMNDIINLITFRHYGVRIGGSTMADSFFDFDGTPFVVDSASFKVSRTRGDKRVEVPTLSPSRLEMRGIRISSGRAREMAGSPSEPRKE